jgi:hypothetical protein
LLKASSLARSNFFSDTVGFGVLGCILALLVLVDVIESCAP